MLRAASRDMATAAQEGCALVAVDASATETKGTVLMKNAEDLMNYNVSEEKAMEKVISHTPCPAFRPTRTLDSHTRTGKHACLAGGPGDRGVGRQRGSLAGCDLGDGYAFHRACRADGCATAVQVRQPPVCHTVLHLACCAFLVVCCA
jgi:hypothetical protein